MPLFIIICGYFSKNLTKDKLKRQLIQFVECYILWSLIINIPFRNLTEFIAPQHSLWFLLSLVFWKIITYLIEKIKFTKHLINSGKGWIILIFCLIISTLSFIAVNTYYHVLAFQRTIQFYPFFLIGYLLKSNQMKKIYDSPKSIAVIILVICSLGIIKWHGYPMMSLFYHYSGIERISSLFETSHTNSLFMFWGSYIIAIAMSFSILVLVRLPEKLAMFGKLTLGIYLLQTFVFVASQYFPTICAPILNSFFLAIMTILLTTLAMQSKHSRYLTNPFTSLHKKLLYPKSPTPLS